MNILPQFRPKDNAICSNPVGKKRWSAGVACTASTDLKHRIMSKSRLINWIVWFFFCSFSTGGHSGWLILCDSGKLGRSFRDKSADVEQTIIRGAIWGEFNRRIDDFMAALLDRSNKHNRNRSRQLSTP